ncbi:hypothetical protein QBC44DRAFT_99442 [Cladorrhinum sp. PSN332]|nr:hypothetical protein QBC44DRAFT_99442 [Cladorrhinum sp. PSN332]
MKAFILATFLAAVVTATDTVEYVDGQFVCPKDAPNGVFCAGTSLETDIIIRCTNGIGQPGRCSNNLVGQPPVGTGIVISRCWASPSNNATAACEKNCIVYGSSGNFNGTFTLPGCQPLWPPLPPPTTTTYTTKTSPPSTKTTKTTYTTTATEDCEETTTTTTPTYTKPPHSWTKPPHHNTTVTYTRTKPPYTYTKSNHTRSYPTGTGTSYTVTTKTKTTTTAVETTTVPNVPVGPTTTRLLPTVVPPVTGAGSGIAKGNSVGALVLVMGLVGLFF